VSPISPTGRKALLRLVENEAIDRRTHISAVHQSARAALVSRGLVAVDGPYLVLTDKGRRAA